MPEWLQAVILGVVQGVTEFVPVSSSGHLVLVPHFFGWEKPSLAFDVALHVGSAAAIVVYYRRDLLAMARGVLHRGDDELHGDQRRLAYLLALASVPVALVGFTLRSLVEVAFESPTLAAGTLYLTGAVLLGGEWFRRRRVRRSGTVAVADHLHEIPAGVDTTDPAGTTLDAMTWRQALVIGGGQAFALVPGLSRSGTTITAGLVAGLTRPAATRFSFLLALPALVGASLVSLPDLREPGMFSGAEIAAGVLASFVAGYFAIAWLVRLLARAGLARFAGYVAAVATVYLILLATGVR